MSDITRLIIVAVGGQGNLLSSSVLGEAALLAGIPLRMSEIHGMAQRGGVGDGEGVANRAGVGELLQPAPVLVDVFGFHGDARFRGVDSDCQGLEVGFAARLLGGHDEDLRFVPSFDGDRAVDVVDEDLSGGRERAGFRDGLGDRRGEGANREGSNREEADEE